MSNTTAKKKPLTPTEKALLEWLKAGKVGVKPKHTGNTYHALDRKGYTRTVRYDGCMFRFEFI
jgi:hypothetical protein